MALPNPLTATDTRGSGNNASAVSEGEIDNISETATTDTIEVVSVYMIAGPAIIRTALRSLVARDIRSPVRWRWKYDRERRCRWAKKSLRKRYSISRDAPMMIRRIQNRHTPPTKAMPISRAA